MTLIDGASARTLRVVPDERGWLMEVLRADDPEFTKFGQVYVSATYPAATGDRTLRRSTSCTSDGQNFDCED